MKNKIGFYWKTTCILIGKENNSKKALWTSGGQSKSLWPMSKQMTVAEAKVEEAASSK